MYALHVIEMLMQKCLITASRHDCASPSNYSTHPSELLAHLRGTGKRKRTKPLLSLNV